MANVKRIIADWNETGITVYCIIRRETDDYRLNDADGDFAAAPADPYLSLSEDAVIKGRYEVDESRVVWDTGKYTVSIYKQAGGSPVPASDIIIANGEIVIQSDLEVYLDAPAALASVCTESRLAELDPANMPADLDLAATQEAVLTRLASTPFATEHPPATVTVTNGTILSGDINSIQTLNQVYLKVQETGKWNVDTTYTNIDEEHTCFYATYRYFGGGSSNHKVEAKIWNYTLAQWDDALATAKDFPAINEDRTLVFDIPGTISDYYTGTAPNLSAQLRIEHESGFSTSHYFWLDTIGFGGLETIYTAPDNAGISALNDTVVDEAQRLFSLIESQRGHHTAEGTTYYWNPINGDDTYDGLTPEAAKKTYTHNGADGIHSLLNDSAHELIIVMPGQAGAVTEINEYIEIDKRYTFLRGPGRDFFINATHNEEAAILLSAEGSEISGCRVNTKLTGSQDGIIASGDFAWVHDVWVDYSRGSGIKIDNSSNCILEDYIVQDAAKGGSGHAVHILGDTSLTTRNFIKNAKMFSNGNGGATDGIRIDGTFCDHNFIVGGERGIIAHDNTGYGINEVNGADHTICIGPSLHLAHNILGTYNLIGASSVMENEGAWVSRDIAQDIHDEAFGKWVLDSDSDTLTLYKADGVTVLKIFDLTSTTGAVPAYITRTPV